MIDSYRALPQFWRCQPPRGEVCIDEFSFDHHVGHHENDAHECWEVCCVWTAFHRGSLHSSGRKCEATLKEIEKPHLDGDKAAVKLTSHLDEQEVVALQKKVETWQSDN